MYGVPEEWSAQNTGRCKGMLTIIFPHSAGVEYIFVKRVDDMLLNGILKAG